MVSGGNTTTPAPSTGDPILDAIAQANTLAGTTSSASSSLYGLGQWGSQTVDPGDLPFLTGIIATGGNTTGDSILKGFLEAAPDQVATIQHALYMAGYYPKTYTPQYGVVRPQDRDAFGHLVTVAGQSGQPVATLLANGAAYGAAAGLAAAQANSAAQARTAEVRLPNVTDLEAAAISAFQRELGHKASPEDAAAFAAAYRAMSAGVQRAGNQQVYDASAPPPDLQQLDPDKTVSDVVGPVPGEKGVVRVGGAHGDLGVRDVVTRQPDQPRPFTDQISGLMQLGQGVAEAGSAQPQGLTQVETETPVDPSTAALNYARNAHPKQAAANDVANTFDTFLSLVLGNLLGG